MIKSKFPFLLVSLPAGYVSFQKVSRESEIYILCICNLYFDIKMYSVAIKRNVQWLFKQACIHPGHNHVGQTINIREWFGQVA